MVLDGGKLVFKVEIRFYVVPEKKKKENFHGKWELRIGNERRGFWNGWNKNKRGKDLRQRYEIAIWKKKGGRVLRFDNDYEKR